MQNQDDKLAITYGKDNTQFTGITGKDVSTKSIEWPTLLGMQRGKIKTSVIPGHAPFLLSVKALRKMQAVVDFNKAVIYIPTVSEKPIKLVVAPNGHFLLPFFNFNNQEMHDYIRTMGRLEPARTEPALAGGATAIPASEPEPGPAVDHEIN